MYLIKSVCAKSLTKAINTGSQLHVVKSAEGIKKLNFRSKSTVHHRVKMT